MLEERWTRLRRVRLDHAHQELMAADPERDSVTAVAYRWGFSSPSRLAAYHRQAYGVPPGSMLRDSPARSPEAR